jgi:hypothetical protein
MVVLSGQLCNWLWGACSLQPGCQLSQTSGADAGRRCRFAQSLAGLTDIFMITPLQQEVYVLTGHLSFPGLVVDCVSQEGQRVTWPSS